MKVIHKYVTGDPKNLALIRSIKTACHMENKTFAFKSNYRWESVTCKRCLKARDK